MSKLARNPQVIWDQVDGMMVLCHLDTGDFFRMNSTGAFIWEVCDGCTIDDIVERLQTTYPDESHEMLSIVVQRYVLSLKEVGLLEEANK